MSGNHRHLAHLGTLPVETLHYVIGLLPLLDIKFLSCTSKRLREACLPSLFRHLRIRLTLAGFEELRALLQSNVCRYVVSFTYALPELLKTGLLDFDRFRSDILTHDRSMNAAKDLNNADSGDQKWPFIDVCRAVNSSCREQCSIIDEGADLILSSVFGALPKLKEVRLSFSEEEYDWVLQPLARGMMMKEEFYKPHLQVIATAVRSARSKGVTVNTITLLNFDINSRWIISLDTLSGSLGQLLEHTRTMRLCGSDCVLQLLSQSELNSRPLDICQAVAVDNVLLGFLESWAQHG